MAKNHFTFLGFPFLVGLRKIPPFWTLRWCMKWSQKADWKPWYLQIEHNWANCASGEEGKFQAPTRGLCPGDTLTNSWVSEEQLPGHPSNSRDPGWRVHIAAFHDSCSKIKRTWSKLSAPLLTFVEHFFCSISVSGMPALLNTASSWPWGVLPSPAVWGHLSARFYTGCGPHPSLSGDWCCFQQHGLWLPVIGVQIPAP